MGGDNDITKLLNEVVKKSPETFRKSIVDVLALSYKAAPLAVVRGALNVSDSSGISSLNHPAIESISADEVTFVSTANNSKRDTVYQEGVNFNDISAMMFDKEKASALEQ